MGIDRLNVIVPYDIALNPSNIINENVHGTRSGFYRPILQAFISYLNNVKRKTIPALCGYFLLSHITDNWFLGLLVDEISQTYFSIFLDSHF